MSRPHQPFSFISAINHLPASATEHLPRKKDGGISGYALGIASQHAHRFDTKKLIEGMDACLAAAAADLKDADYRELAFKCCARVMGADRVFPLEEETVLGRVQQLLGLSDADAARLLVLATR